MFIFLNATFASILEPSPGLIGLLSLFGVKDDDCFKFLQGLFEVNPKNRLTIPEALNHPWMKNALSGSADYNKEASIDADVLLRL